MGVAQTEPAALRSSHFTSPAIAAEPAAPPAVPITVSQPAMIHHTKG